MAALAPTPFPSGRRYSPVRLLGRGGMGAVYEAEDHDRGARVALKVMLRQDAEHLLRFKREFRTVADLHHPNLVRLFELSVEESCWFFTMELVDGQPLTELLDPRSEPGTRCPEAVPDTTRADTSTSVAEVAVQSGPAPAEPAEVVCDLDVFRAVLGQLLDALEHLHERGIVHRDLKPSNVLVDVRGTVRLLDFGLASHLDRSLDITATGAIAGTLGYMSPEQIRGEAITPASDLYSLGCLMFRLLTGRLPFEGSEAQMLQGHALGPPPRVERRVRGVPPPIAEVVFRLLSREPSARPSIVEIRGALGVRRSPAPRGEVLVDAAPFVGRAAELATLRERLHRAESGAAQLVLVSGPSGIGKSALAGRVAEEAIARGHQVFRGRCYEREQLPFVTLDRAVDAMIVALAAWPAERLRPLEAALRELQRPFPAMAMLTHVSRPSDLRPRAGAAPVDVLCTYRRFGEVVARLAAERPVVLALDDLQWADDESVDLLLVLLAEARGRITVLGTCRPEALDPGRPGRRLLDAAGAAGASIALAPLGEDEARGLLDRVAGGVLDDGARAAIVAQAGGNPFLLVELARRFGRAVIEYNSYSEHAGGVVSALLDDLSPGAARVLSVAAAAGGDVSERLLVEAAGVRGADFERALDELFARRLVMRLADEPLAPGRDVGHERDGGGPARRDRRLDVYHDRIREAAYQRLPPDQRRALHEDIARILEANVQGHARDVEALLRHWTLAGDLDRRRRFALQASERAEKQLAYRHAARLLRIVCDAPEPGEPASVVTARWERLGDLHAWSGQLRAAAEAYQRALDGWEAAPPGEERDVALLRLQGHLGEVLAMTGDLARSADVLEGGARLAGFTLRRHPVVQILVLVVLAVRLAIAPLVPRAGRRDAGALASARLAFVGCAVRALVLVAPRSALEAALRGEIYARRVHDVPVLVRAWSIRAVMPALVGRFSSRRMRRAWSALGEADALARAAGDADGVCVVRAHESLLWLRADMDRARAGLESALAGLAERGMADSHDGARTRRYLLAALMLKSDFRDAIALAERELARSPEDVAGRVVVLGLRAQALAYLGRADEAADDLRALRDLLTPIPACGLHVHAALARTVVLTAQGRHEEALGEAVAFERAARPRRIAAGAVMQSAMREAVLEACLGLARRGPLSPERRSLAARSAGWLARRGLADFGCAGHRGRALLFHHAGNTAAARRAVERALEASAVNVSRWHRYVCLEAAREITGLTSSQEEEAARLREGGGFGEPFCRAQARPPTDPARDLDAIRLR